MKCENCGATFRADKRAAFCPFCGNSLKLPDTVVDLEEVRANHVENMRKLEYEENKRSDKNDNKILIGAVIFVVLGILFMFGMAYIPKWSEDGRIRDKIAKVQQLVQTGDYDTALFEVQEIRIEKQSLFDSRFDNVENQRKELIRLIEQKKKESGK